MALSNYTELKASIADWLNRDDLTSAIVDFIRLAEAKFERHPACVYERHGTITLDSKNVDVPTDVQTIIALWYDDGTRYGPIEVITPERIAELKAIQGPLTGWPRWVAVTKNGSELLCAPDPATGSYVANMTYVSQLERLSATVDTNWILYSYPDLYLFGALLEAEPYLKNDERIPVWQSKFEQGLAELNALVKRRQYTGMTLVQKPKRAIG